MLKDVFGYAEHQEKRNFGFTYRQTLTKNSDNSVVNKDNATNIGRTKLKSVDWYVPNYAPSIAQQAIYSKQFLSRTPTELQYVERSVFMKKVITQNLWIFELGTQERVNVPFWIIIGFYKRD